jgi:hypothetical protein
MSALFTLYPWSQVGNDMAAQGAIAGAAGIFAVTLPLVDEWDGVSVIRLSNLGDIKLKLCVPVENKERMKVGY